MGDDIFIEKADIVFTYPFSIKFERQTVINAINAAKAIAKAFENTGLSTYTNNYQNMQYCPGTNDFHCSFDLLQMVQDIEDLQEQIRKFSNNETLMETLTENEILKTENNRLINELEIYKEEDKRKKTPMKGAGKENISSNKKGQPNPTKDKNSEDLTAKLVTLEKEKRELVTKKGELETNKNKEITILAQKLKEIEWDFEKYKKTSSETIASYEMELAKKPEISGETLPAQESSNQNKAESLNASSILEQVLKVHQSSETLRARNIALQKEVRILRKSLVLSYYEYGSLTAIKLLDILVQLIFDQHASNKSEVGQKACKILKSQLSLPEQPNTKHNYECLAHLKTCAFHIDKISDPFKEILEQNTSLNMFIHSIDNLHEIVVNGRVSEMNQCADVLNKVLRHLKNKFSTNRIVAQLPSEVIRVSESNPYDFYQKLGCYKMALNEEPSD